MKNFIEKNKSRSNEGSGLGLPIAKRIIELYGGNILAEKINEDIKFKYLLRKYRVKVYTFFLPQIINKS